MRSLRSRSVNSVQIDFLIQLSAQRQGTLRSKSASSCFLKKLFDTALPPDVRRRLCLAVKVYSISGYAPGSRLHLTA